MKTEIERSRCGSQFYLFSYYDYITRIVAWLVSFPYYRWLKLYTNKDFESEDIRFRVKDTTEMFSL